MTNQNFAEAVKQFADNLDNSISMEDRRDAVGYLADKIGSESANKIAEVFGLTRAYYKA